MKSASAFCPSYVTGFFHISEQEEDPLYKGSLGAGFCLAKGVRTTISAHSSAKKDEIFINNELQASAKVSRAVLDIFFEKAKEPRVTKFKIEHQIQVPQGTGFGTSGAGALSLSVALNKLYGLPLTNTETYQVAHLAEIACRTGLGTVLSEVHGGFMIRTNVGAPGIGTVKQLPFPKDYLAAFIVFGPLSTSLSLSDPKVQNKINALGVENIHRLEQNPSPQEFVVQSHRFATGSDLLTDNCRFALDYLKEYNIEGSMNMFGDSVFALVQKKEEKSLEYIKQIPRGKVLILELSNKGVAEL